MSNSATNVELGSVEFWNELRDNPARLSAQVCTIDIANLNQTLQQHAALRAWVVATHEGARSAEEHAQWEVTKARAKALLHAKESLDPNTGKAKIAVVLESEVEADDAVQTAEKKLMAASEKRGVLKAMATALEDRTQMLIQLSANQRAEARDYT